MWFGAFFSIFLVFMRCFVFWLKWVTKWEFWTKLGMPWFSVTTMVAGILTRQVTCRLICFLKKLIVQPIKKNIRLRCGGLRDPDVLGHQARVPRLFWQVFFYIYFFNYFYSLFRCKKKLRKKFIRPDWVDWVLGTGRGFNGLIHNI